MKKNKIEIVIPIIIAIILVAVFVYLDYVREEKKPESLWSVTSEPIPPSENPRRSEDLTEKNIDYACGGPGSINLVMVKEADPIWKIDKRKRTISLGRYRIRPPAHTVLDVPKLWLNFLSQSLSDRDDEWYGLEESYVSRMVLMVNGHEREIKLGGDKYMFIELKDYPLGDYYPYEDMDLEFEFLIELECNNLKKRFLRKSVCLDNEGNPLDYINNADIHARIRVFALGCREFTNDIVIDAVIEHE